MRIDRPAQLIGVLGTHTEVGKTYVTARWLAALRAKGVRVAARKPVQSFDAADGATDAQELARATGEDETAVCSPHRAYPLALAPPIAADLLRRPRIAMDDLIAEIRWPSPVDVGVIETVGGPRSPIAHDGDSIDLVKRLKVDRVLLVADAGLGTLNAVRLSLACAAGFEVVVYLNRYDEEVELHRLNRRWLAEKYGVNAIVTMAELLEAFPVRRTPQRPANRDANLRRE